MRGVTEMDFVVMDVEPPDAQATCQIATDTRGSQLREGEPGDGGRTDRRGVIRIGRNRRQPQSQTQHQQNKRQCGRRSGTCQYRTPRHAGCTDIAGLPHASVARVNAD
jgi:hypothetical protein